MAVVVYSTPSCPWCTKAKEFLKTQKISFTELDVSQDETARKEMLEKSKQLGVPVLDVNGIILVGFNPQAIHEAVKKTA